MKSFLQALKHVVYSAGICTLEDGSICEQDKSWVDCEVADGLKDCPVIDEPGNIMKDKKYNTVRAKTNKQTNKINHE